MSRGAFSVDRIGDVRLVIGAVKTLAVPARRKVDLHPDGIALRILLEVRERGCFGRSADVWTYVSDMCIEVVASFGSHGIAGCHSVKDF